MLKIGLAETVVIYHSEADAGWVAHGLRTDQIGIADTPVDALAQLLRLLEVLCEEAAKDSTLAYLREAPQEIQQLAEQSEILPGEIFEVAHWKAHGRWPETWQVPTTAGRSSFVAQIHEPVC